MGMQNYWNLLYQDERERGSFSHLGALAKGNLTRPVTERGGAFNDNDKLWGDLIRLQPYTCVDKAVIVKHLGGQEIARKRGFSVVFSTFRFGVDLERG